MKKIKRIILSLVLIASLVLAVVLFISSMKIKTIYETDFETNVGWFMEAGSARLEQSNEQSYSGNSSLKISGCRADWHGARIPGVKTGILLDNNYHVSAMLYSEAEIKVVMQLTLKKADGSLEYKWLESPTLRPDVWTKYYSVLNIPSDEYASIESISFENKTEPFSDSYYVDEIKITKSAKVPPLSIAGIALLAVIAVAAFMLLLHDILSGKRKDALTGAYSRDIIEKDLPVIISKALVNQKNTCLIMADLDHFKRVNDTYGHAAGDIVLKNFSEIIQHCIRRKDWVARYGGEEFLIFLFDASAKDGKLVAERIRKKLEEFSVTVDEKEIRVTASFGVAALIEDDLKSAQDLMKCADQNLYTAKKSGRNQVC